MAFKAHGPGGCCCTGCSFDFRPGNIWQGAYPPWIIEWSGRPWWPTSTVTRISGGGVNTEQMLWIEPFGVGQQGDVDACLNRYLKVTATVTLTGNIGWGIGRMGRWPYYSGILPIIRKHSGGYSLLIINYYKASPQAGGYSRMSLREWFDVPQIQDGVPFDFEMRVASGRETISGVRDRPSRFDDQQIAILINDELVAKIDGLKNGFYEANGEVVMFAVPASWPESLPEDFTWLTMLNFTTGVANDYTVDRAEEYASPALPPENSGSGGSFVVENLKGGGLSGEWLPTQWTPAQGCTDPLFRWTPLATDWLDVTQNRYWYSVSGTNIPELNNTQHGIRRVYYLGGILYPIPDYPETVIIGIDNTSYGTATGSVLLGGDTCQIYEWFISWSRSHGYFWWSMRFSIRALPDPPTMPPSYLWGTTANIGVGWRPPEDVTLPVTLTLDDFDFALMFSTANPLIPGTPPDYGLTDVLGSGFTLTLDAPL